MLIADTFKLDRLYTRQFRKLVATSLQKRNNDSIHKLLLEPLKQQMATEKIRKIPTELTQTPKRRHNSHVENTTPKKRVDILNMEGCATDQDDKVLNFLDSNLIRIHTSKREASLRKRYNSRCSTQSAMGNLNLQSHQINCNFSVRKIGCFSRKAYEQQNQGFLRSSLGKVRNLGKVKKQKTNNKENKFEFCPWDYQDD